MTTATETTSIVGLTGAQLLTWVAIFLNYTDAVLGDLPEDDAALDWRPTDEAGTWHFSIREQAMHIVDQRLEVMRDWIEGTDVADQLFQREYGANGAPWEFRSGSKAEILAVCKATREMLDTLLAQPAEGLLATSPGLVKQYEEGLAKMRADGKDTAEREARGPARIVNILLFLVAHEQAHRAVLQTMLRQRGHTVTRYA
jgi:uncharacterized damage-inducible protein DinB